MEVWLIRWTIADSHHPLESSLYWSISTLNQFSHGLCLNQCTKSIFFRILVDGIFKKKSRRSFKKERLLFFAISHSDALIFLFFNFNPMICFKKKTPSINPVHSGPIFKQTLSNTFSLSNCELILAMLKSFITNNRSTLNSSSSVSVLYCWLQIRSCRQKIAVNTKFHKKWVNRP